MLGFKGYLPLPLISFSTVAKRVRVLFNVTVYKVWEEGLSICGQFHIESKKAVFIDASVNFKFRLPPHPLSFSVLSFHTLNCCWFSPGWFLSLSLLADLLIRSISSITFLTFELNESWRISTESAEILCVKDIAFINSTIVCSLMHLYMTETDLDSVVTEINILNKIQKWSDSATSSITMNELIRSLLMSKSRVCPRLSVGPCTCWLWSKCLKHLYFLL